MALLGHTARVIIGTESLDRSVVAWQELGFAVQDADENRVRMTDGQVLLSLLLRAEIGVNVAYFHTDPLRLASVLHERGVDARDATAEGCIVTIADGLSAYVHQRSADHAERHSGAKNAVLGYLDALSLGVPDVSHARQHAEHLGFFVQEEWQGAQPRSDVTDGLLTVSFQQRRAAPYLAYAVEITPNVMAELEGLENVQVEPTSIAGEISYVRLTTPEGTRVVLLHDDNYE